jgi:ubiquinol-cytochrome c reductase cytochrome c subunit
MGFAADEQSPGARGRATFDLHCASCHGITGKGGYLGVGVRVPSIVSAGPRAIVNEVRQGDHRMPAFSAAVIPDGTLAELATYVSTALAHPPEEGADLGPRTLDPLAVGVAVWAILGLLCCSLAVLFAEGRN